jgi:A/G-specific adenine glycosylase
MSVDASNALLRWYDTHRRRLPWRALPDERSDPYRVWMSEIMLQQTTVAAVRSYFETFTARWPTVADLARADEGEVMAAWAGLGYYARARNLIACARRVTERGGVFPDTEEGLRELPGIGRYTAAAIAAIAFGRRAVVVDANVERVVARYFAVEQPLPAARPQLYALTDRITPEARSGDFAQAMMDLGATICTARNPACAICPLMDACEARRRGEQHLFPAKTARPAKPRRQGIAYWLERDGEVLLVRRPERGLLGGMLALPTGDWSEQAGEAPPADAEWRDAGSIQHVFTHFALDIRLLCGEAQCERKPGEIWWPAARIGEAGLPTVFAKLAARGVEWRASV